MMRLNKVEKVTKADVFKELELKEVCGRIWLREGMHCLDTYYDVKEC
jgi:hypothetical protein